MSKKKLNSLESLGGFVFSTNDDFKPEAIESEEETPSASQQHLEAHFSNKGRGGKTVTVIKGFVGSHEDLKSLGKTLKTKLGVGGSVKEGEIIIQGDYRNRIIEILKALSYNVKRVGG
ncbi:translation initiation factor [Ascidiimonas sp. W6]|uniref:translation initiation factor n=1 Tax=Ascidiimonas meishanensis TaxID=3128903 RepID=UPI0030EF82C9